jgi:hypothetical protein
MAFKAKQREESKKLADLKSKAAGKGPLGKWNLAHFIHDFPNWINIYIITITPHLSQPLFCGHSFRFVCSNWWYQKEREKVGQLRSVRKRFGYLV